MRAPSSTFRQARRPRREMTLPEVTLWQRLRRHGVVDARWRRQHPIGPYILDFYCPAARLAVEVDGTAHDLPDRAARDARRDAWLLARGIRVLRFTAPDVLRDESLESVLDTIAAAVTREL